MPVVFARVVIKAGVAAAALLAAFNNPRPLFLHPCDEALEPRHEVLPVVVCDGAADFISARVIR